MYHAILGMVVESRRRIVVMNNVGHCGYLIIPVPLQQLPVLWNDARPNRGRQRDQNQRMLSLDSSLDCYEFDKDFQLILSSSESSNTSFLVGDARDVAMHGGCS